MFPRIDMKATGRRIQALRERQGLSVRDLQGLMGFEQPQAVYKWQRGECLPTVDHLLILSRIFGLPMQDILVIDDQDIAGCQKSGEATFLSYADECFLPQNVILLQETPRPTGKAGRYDFSLADGEFVNFFRRGLSALRDILRGCCA